MKNSTLDWLDETCGNCKFYNGGSLSCKRHAPVLVQRNGFATTEYPSTYFTEWCGEWEFQTDYNIRAGNVPHDQQHNP